MWNSFRDLEVPRKEVCNGRNEQEGLGEGLGRGNGEGAAAAAGVGEAVKGPEATRRP